jgi:DNA processing protein
LNEKELPYLLALQKIKGIGTINAKKLIAHTGSASAIFSEKKSTLKKINGIGDFIIQNLHDKEVLSLAQKESEYILGNKLSYTFFTEKNYPEQLKHCIDAPLVLFMDGKINLENHPVVSIVGTRNMTHYGQSFLEKLMEDIAPYNPVIVSGFAYGVDITAHKYAMKNKLQTVAVMAHGLDHVYPKTHKKHVREVVENGGFITEFWHDEPPVRENFLQRNRIIAGLSDATIIVESAAKGGSLVTAEIANSYNRDVFAVPGRTTDVFSQGCNNLIRTNKAQLLNSASDLIYFLNWDQSKQKDKKIQPELFIDLQGEEKKLYEYLKENGKMALDELSLELKIPIYKLSGTLLDMELRGLIRPLPGKQFEII